MAIAVSRLKRYYMERVDQNDYSTVENIQRYIDLIELYRSMQKSIKSDGARIEVENGSQSFIKSHPLISDMKNINAQLINLKKDIDKAVREYELKLIEEEKSKEYTSEDLI